MTSIGTISGASARAAGLPLLSTKLYLPAPRATTVARRRLIARVLEGLSTRLTLFAAPAGFGKSTLLAQALGEARRLPDAPRIGWVALDGGDNDPTRFWSYACAALERASPGLGAQPLALLRAAPAEHQAALAELLNALAAHPEPVVLAFDDYHAIVNPAIHSAVAALLAHAPPQLHLLIAGRTEPPLPLARWRVSGELVEIRAADLRFTAAEALEFLAGTMGLRLDAEHVALLEARTEGWAAGLQLAALSLQGQADARGFIDSFSGSHRHIVDYLTEEVLARQPEHIRTFLLETSILGRMCGPLCDAVVGLAAADERPAPAAGAAADSYSRLVLDELERQNLFLIPLDDQRGWYRYHHLFADLLRHRLGHEQPALVAELHRRAARWFERQGAVAEAMGHALAAGESELATRLLAAHAGRLAANGEMQTLQRWLDALPREQMLANPRLCLAQVQVLLFERQVAVLEPYIQAAEAALAGAAEPDAVALRGELLSQRAHIAIECGAFADALALARQAQAMLPDSEHWARSTNGLMLGYALMVLGHTAEAATVHAENIRRSRAAGNALSALFSATEVVKLAMLQGRLGEARASAEQALSWVAAEGWEQLAPASALHIWLGNALLEQGDLAAAGEQLAHAIRLSGQRPTITAARSHAFLARLRQLEGDTAAASVALAEVDRICQGWQPGGERAFFEAYSARVRVMQGDMPAARRWAGQRAPWSPSESPSYFREIELLTLARVALIAEAEPDDAAVAEQLAWLREHAQAGGRTAVVIEALTLEALAHRRHSPALAHQRLDAALALAAPEGMVGVFAELGPPIGGMLAQSQARRAPDDPLRPYLARLLSVVARAPKSAPEQGAPQARAALPGAEALTEREAEVLRLFAAGLTSAEIARHFVVSINTVKTQLKSIYGKLGAHSRAEAVARARELGIMERGGE